MGGTTQLSRPKRHRPQYLRISRRNWTVVAVAMGEGIALCISVDLGAELNATPVLNFVNVTAYLFGRTIKWWHPPPRMPALIRDFPGGCHPRLVERWG